MSGKTILDFDRDDKITGTEVVYAVDNGKDVNISVDDIKDFVLKQIPEKTPTNDIELSSVNW